VPKEQDYGEYTKRRLSSDPKRRSSYILTWKGTQIKTQQSKTFDWCLLQGHGSAVNQVLSSYQKDSLRKKRITSGKEKVRGRKSRLKL